MTARPLHYGMALQPDGACIVFPPIVHRWPRTLDFVEQHDRERAQLCWQRLYGAPARTRPLLAVDNGPVAGVRR